MNTSPARDRSTTARAILAGAIALAFVLIALFWSFLRAIGDALAAVVDDHRDAVASFILAFLALLLLAIVRVVFALGRRLDRAADQAAIVRLENDHPIDVANVRGMALASQSLRDHYAAKIAEASRPMPNVTSYHQSTRVDGGTSPAVLDDKAPALCHESEWLTWTDSAPHLMVAGRTDSGKTTTVEAILARRVVKGDLVLVIDPHFQDGKWLGAYTVGGGRDYAACYDTFDAARRLLDRRYTSYNAGTRTEDFRRVTIVVDEVPAIIAHGQMDKATYERWLLFATSLGSEARKVRVSVVLVTQSQLVRDIGISSAMRDNYARIALGDTAADLLREDPMPARRAALLELLRGRPYPAAMEYRNSWHALRNDDLPDLARSPGVVPRVPTLLVTSAPAPSTTTMAPARDVPPTIPLPQPTVREMIKIVLESKRRWMTSTAIAAASQVDKTIIMTEITTMASAGDVARRKAPKLAWPDRWEYAANQSIT